MTRVSVLKQPTCFYSVSCCISVYNSATAKMGAKELVFKVLTTYTLKACTNTPTQFGGAKPSLYIGPHYVSHR